MPAAHVTRPTIALPQHLVTADEICADIAQAHPQLPHLAASLRIARSTQVTSRYFTRPLQDPAIGGDAAITERNRAAFTEASILAVRAAQQTLQETGTTPRDIDCIITSHTTSWTVPGLDVHLVEALGLRADVRRIPMSTLGCAGGAHALVRARDHIAAHPGSIVLVVVAEMLSTVYSHHDTTTASMIYKTLFGDGAGACLVTGAPLGPGLCLESTWEYLLPDSRTRYAGRLDQNGLHFDSEKSATAAIVDLMPALHRFLAQQELRDVEFTVLHPGGPRIILDAEAGLGIDQEPGLDGKAKKTRHSWASLREEGNLGGVAVLSVLARTHDDPPADGARGILLGFGPGFAVAAATARWETGPSSATPL
ncbi:type III polyketide synthase [Streptomyces arenae]|uniref:type III polyketide synthase n=1 Tax=Streptomyces arenae TaxID=29301 RepID=UPI0026584985|nr:PhlD [Streptomyces arenae]MCG7202311.1 PhlD [Streptomyces arenae]